MEGTDSEKKKKTIDVLNLLFEKKIYIYPIIYIKLIIVELGH